MMIALAVQLRKGPGNTNAEENDAASPLARLAKWKKSLHTKITKFDF
jgi:hypothetical protein